MEQDELRIVLDLPSNAWDFPDPCLGNYKLYAIIYLTTQSLLASPKNSTDGQTIYAALGIIHK